MKVLDSTAFRRAVPAEVKVPGLHGTTITVRLEVDADPVRVVADGLDAQRMAVLAPGSLDLVRSTCDTWTRWLAESTRRVEKVAAS